MPNGSYKIEMGCSFYCGRVEVVLSWPPARQPFREKSLVEDFFKSYQLLALANCNA
jgi:hypothetical protein